MRAYSREANDLGQWIFALFVAMAFTAATRAQTHLAADGVARSYSTRTRAVIARLGAPLGLVPWALLVLVAGKNIVISSLLVPEAFPDTCDPGCLSMKSTLWQLSPGP